MMMPQFDVNEAGMGRIANHGELEIEAAKRLAVEAKSLMQLRQSQAILIPALTGASMDTTAEILGLGRNRVCVLRREFRASGYQGVEAKEKRGGAAASTHDGRAGNRLSGALGREGCRRRGSRRAADPCRAGVGGGAQRP